MMLFAGKKKFIFLYPLLIGFTVVRSEGVDQGQSVVAGGLRVAVVDQRVLWVAVMAGCYCSRRLCAWQLDMHRPGLMCGVYCHPDISGVHYRRFKFPRVLSQVWHCSPPHTM